MLLRQLLLVTNATGFISKTTILGYQGNHSWLPRQLPWYSRTAKEITLAFEILLLNKLIKFMIYLQKYNFVLSDISRSIFQTAQT